MIKVFCPYDSYECFRELHCFSRFCKDYRCTRHVHVVNNRVTRRLTKVVSNELVVFRKGLRCYS